MLHHCLDLPVETVAAQTGVSPGTVKSGPRSAGRAARPRRVPTGARAGARAPGGTACPAVTCPTWTSGCARCPPPLPSTRRPAWPSGSPTRAADDLTELLPRPDARARRDRPVGLRPRGRPLDGPAGAPRRGPPGSRPGVDDLDGAGRAGGRAAGGEGRRQGPHGHRGRPLRSRPRPLDPNRPAAPPPGRRAGAGQGRRGGGGAVRGHRLRPGRDRWAHLPAGPDRAGTAPAGTGSLERALLWTVGRASGAVQVYVLVPAGP